MFPIKKLQSVFQMYLIGLQHLEILVEERQHITENILFTEDFLSSP